MGLEKVASRFFFSWLAYLHEIMMLLNQMFSNYQIVNLRKLLL